MLVKYITCHMNYKRDPINKAVLIIKKELIFITVFISFLCRSEMCFPILIVYDKHLFGENKALNMKL